MSHFTVTVALPGHIENDKLEAALNEALAPFDENLVVDRFVEFTREQLIAEGRKEIERYRDGLYARYLAEPATYAAEYGSNSTHLAYLSGEASDGGFPARLTWSDEQVYSHQLRDYDAQDIGSNGEVYSQYNPKSQWDWWVVGGRWGGSWTLKEGAESGLRTESSAFGMSDDSQKPGATDCARIGDIAAESMAPTFALITLDGDWVERGRMGWFGVAADEKNSGEWEPQYRKWLTSLDKDTWVVNVDAHI